MSRPALVRHDRLSYRKRALRPKISGSAAEIASDIHGERKRIIHWPVSELVLKKYLMFVYTGIKILD